MAETLLAIVLVTSSANGRNLICRWPPSPQASPRLARPRPSVSYYDPDPYDNPWRSANFKDGIPDDNGNAPPALQRAHDELEYIWQRPCALRDRSHSISRSTSLPTPSGRASPTKDGSVGGGAGGGGGAGASGRGGGGVMYDVDVDTQVADVPLQDEYGALLGYSAEVFAGLLLPKRPLCHQKFALADDDGTWRFKREKDARDRGARKRRASVSVSASAPMSADDVSSSTEFESSAQEGNGSPPPPPTSSWLETFHVAFVHEVPDPSSQASGNIGRYFDVIYQQVAFTLTAMS